MRVYLLCKNNRKIGYLQTESVKCQKQSSFQKIISFLIHFFCLLNVVYHYIFKTTLFLKTIYLKKKKIMYHYIFSLIF